VSEKQDGSNRVLSLSQEKFCADGKKQEGKVRLCILPYVASKCFSCTVIHVFRLKKKSVKTL
jgi:hypothetical protein